MANKTAQAIAKATAEQQRDEQIKRIETQLELLTQQIAQLVELLQTASAPALQPQSPDAPKRKRQ